MPRASSASMICLTPGLRSSASPSTRTPCHSVLSRSHTTHLTLRSMRVTCIPSGCWQSSFQARALKRVVRQHQLVYFVGSFDDPHHGGVAQVTAHGIVDTAAVRSVQMHGIVSNPDGGRRSIVFCE